VGELLLHLGIAILAVTFLVMLAMGWRGGLVVFFSVPLTFAHYSAIICWIIH
jgi:multidrug efflux pump subunit AcrB